MLRFLCDFLLLPVLKGDHVLLGMVDVTVSKTASEACVPLPIRWLLCELSLKGASPYLLSLRREVIEGLRLLRPDASLKLVRGISLWLSPLVLAIGVGLGIDGDRISCKIFELVAG